MLKFIVFVVVAAATRFVLAEADCRIMAESYVVDMDNTQPALYMGRTREGELVFHVKAELRGLNSLFEVVLKPTECDYVSLRALR